MRFSKKAILIARSTSLVNRFLQSYNSACTIKLDITLFESGSLLHPPCPPTLPINPSQLDQLDSTINSLQIVDKPHKLVQSLREFETTTTYSPAEMTFFWTFSTKPLPSSLAPLFNEVSPSATIQPSKSSKDNPSLKVQQSSLFYAVDPILDPLGISTARNISTEPLRDTNLPGLPTDGSIKIRSSTIKILFLNHATAFNISSDFLNRYTNRTSVKVIFILSDIDDPTFTLEEQISTWNDQLYQSFPKVPRIAIGFSESGTPKITYQDAVLTCFNIMVTDYIQVSRPLPTSFLNLYQPKYNSPYRYTTINLFDTIRINPPHHHHGSGSQSARERGAMSGYGQQVSRRSTSTTKNSTSMKITSPRPLIYTRLKKQVIDQCVATLSLVMIQWDSHNISQLLGLNNRHHQPDNVVSDIRQTFSNFLIAASHYIDNKPKIQFLICGSRLIDFQPSLMPAGFWDTILLFACSMNKIEELILSGPSVDMSSMIELHASHNFIKCIDPQINQLQNLRVIDLRSNQLTTIPHEIFSLNQLEVLDLGFNQLETISSEIGKLTKLRYLYLDNNQIESLPFSFFLQNLIILDIENNLLANIPPSITNLVALSVLRLEGNPCWKDLPISVRSANLDVLKAYIKELNERGEHCYRTKLMVVGQENVGKTSLIRAIHRFKLTKMKESEHHSASSLLPMASTAASGGTVHLSSSATFSPTLGSIHSDTLKYLHSPSSRPPYYSSSAASPSYASKNSVTIQGNRSNHNDSLSTILSNPYLEAPFSTDGIDIHSISFDIDRNYHSSVSSQKYQNLDTQLDPSTCDQLTSPKGPLFLNNPKSRLLTFNVWDFAGQEVYYSTHCFFLTRRSIFLIVFSLLQGLESGRLEHWLNSIKTYAPESPIFIVGTHLDAPKQYKLQSESLLAPFMTRYRTCFNIIGCVYVSCRTLKNIDELVGTLISMAMKQPYMKCTLPLLYFSLEEVLMMKRANLENQNQLPILTWDEVVYLAKKSKYLPFDTLSDHTKSYPLSPNVVKLSTSSGSLLSFSKCYPLSSIFLSFSDRALSIKNLNSNPTSPTIPTIFKSTITEDLSPSTTLNPARDLNYEAHLSIAIDVLHELGSIFRFPDISGVFNSFVILNPQWITNIFSTIIASKTNFIRDGIISLSDLFNQVWKGYPSYLHLALLKILESFEIAFRISNESKQAKGQASNTLVQPLLTDLLISSDSISYQKASNPMFSDLSGHGDYYEDIKSSAPWIGASSYQLTDQILIPAVLPETRPDFRLTWPDVEPDTKRIQYTLLYEFGFMPTGLFSRFIARMCKFFHVIRYWRYGMLVVNYLNETDLAMVEQHAHLNLVSIKVRGLNPAEFLRMITELLDSLLANRFTARAKISAMCPMCIRNQIQEPTTFTKEECLQSCARGNWYMCCRAEPSFDHLISIEQLAPDVTMSDFEGRRIDFLLEVEVGKKIGIGASGIVKLGRYNNEQVAIKFFNAPDQIFQNDEAAHIAKIYDEFRREVWIMSGLCHPCIVNIKGFSLAPKLAMIMEYVKHGDLYSYLHQCKLKNSNLPVLDWPMLLRIAYDVAKGLGFLHSTNPPILHRDVKSPNILLSSLCPTSNQIVAKISDFGLTALVYSDHFAAQKPSERDIVNPRWLAPEIMREQPYGTAADVFSYGIILWELYVGTEPYEEYNLQFMHDLEMVIKEGYRPTIPDDCPQAYAELIRSCWASEPEHRPSFKFIIEHSLPGLIKSFAPQIEPQIQLVISLEQIVSLSKSSSSKCMTNIHHLDDGNRGNLPKQDSYNIRSSQFNLSKPINWFTGVFQTYIQMERTNCRLLDDVSHIRHEHVLKPPRYITQVMNNVWGITENGTILTLNMATGKVEHSLTNAVQVGISYHSTLDITSNPNSFSLKPPSNIYPCSKQEREHASHPSVNHVNYATTLLSPEQAASSAIVGLCYDPIHQLLIVGQQYSITMFQCTEHMKKTYVYYYQGKIVELEGHRRKKKKIRWGVIHEDGIFQIYAQEPPNPSTTSPMMNSTFSSTSSHSFTLNTPQTPCLELDLKECIIKYDVDNIIKITNLRDYHYYFESVEQDETSRWFERLSWMSDSLKGFMHQLPWKTLWKRSWAHDELQAQNEVNVDPPASSTCSLYLAQEINDSEWDRELVDSQLCGLWFAFDSIWAIFSNGMIVRWFDIDHHHSVANGESQLTWPSFQKKIIHFSVQHQSHSNGMMTLVETAISTLRDSSLSQAMNHDATNTMKPPSHVAVTPDALWLSFGRDIIIIDPLKNQIRDCLHNHESTILAMVSIGEQVWSYSIDQTIYIWAQKTAKPIHSIKAERSIVSGGMIQVGSDVLMAHKDSHISVWSSSNRQRIAFLPKKHQDNILGLYVVEGDVKMVLSLSSLAISVWK